MFLHFATIKCKYTSSEGQQKKKEREKRKRKKKEYSEKWRNERKNTQRNEKIEEREIERTLKEIEKEREKRERVQKGKRLWEWRTRLKGKSNEANEMQLVFYKHLIGKKKPQIK